MKSSCVAGNCKANIATERDNNQQKESRNGKILLEWSKGATLSP